MATSAKTTSYSGVSGAIRLQDVIQRFSGEKPGEEITVWIRQVRLVARLQNLGDLCAVVPLFLDGPALAVYEQMSSADQEDIDKIFGCLKKAFSIDIFEAFQQFKSRTRQPGEAVEVFLSELRRLGSLAGVVSDDLLRVAFVSGLPTGVMSQLRALPNVETMALDKLVEISRALMSEIVREEKSVRTDACEFGAVASRQRWTARSIDVSAAQDRGSRRELRCYDCGGPHLRKWCKQRRCFRCGEHGHLANACSQQQSSGNGVGKSLAPAGSQ
jgi:hypothetical protein